MSEGKGNQREEIKLRRSSVSVDTASLWTRSRSLGLKGGAFLSRTGLECISVWYEICIYIHFNASPLADSLIPRPHSPSHLYTHLLFLSFSLSLTHSHIRRYLVKRTFTVRHTHTLILKLSLSLSLTHRQTLLRSVHTQNDTYTHLHLRATQSRSTYSPAVVLKLSYSCYQWWITP